MQEVFRRSLDIQVFVLFVLISNTAYAASSLHGQWTSKSLNSDPHARYSRMTSSAYSLPIVYKRQLCAYIFNFCLKRAFRKLYS
uniref:Uncharacterized protein n=1 Tax=Rhipicephalus microplus TaxID=6941 RepID=A0A6M2DBE3_RHIMP